MFKFLLGVVVGAYASKKSVREKCYSITVKGVENIKRLKKQIEEKVGD
jgi:DNA-binding PadR family transcriptional regulator